MIEFILLSGYADFEYAKQAIAYRVFNYLLKPCNENQIIEAVKKLRGDTKKKKDKELIPDTALTDAPRYQYKDYINQTLDYIDTHFLIRNCL